MSASVQNSLASKLSATSVILPPKAAATDGADFAKELNRAKDGGKADAERVKAKSQAGVKKASKSTSVSAKAAKASKKSSVSEKGEPPQTDDAVAAASADPIALTEAGATAESAANSANEPSPDKSKPKSDSPSAKDAVTPIVNNGIPASPVATDAPTAEPKNTDSSAAAQASIERTAVVIPNIPNDAVPNAASEKTAESKPKQSPSDFEESLAKASTTRGKVPVVAPLVDSEDATPVIAPTTKATATSQSPAATTDGAAEIIPTDPNASDAAANDKHSDNTPSTASQGPTLQAQSAVPHTSGSIHPQTVASPAPEPLPPEVRFATANHATIVSDVRTRLLPHGGSMQIRLDPPELGALQVSVEMRDGAMTATFQTSNEDATRLLSHSLGQLKTALESQGVTVEKIQVQQSPKNENSQSQEEQSPQQQRDEANARQEQQRREMLNRMWRRVSGANDPVDLVA